jgi:tRNA(fMet)-specific endonuclease VapC
VFVLDTDHLTFLERPTGPEGRRLQERLQPIPPDERVTTIITYEEQTRGRLASVAKARTQVQRIEAYRRLNRHLDYFRYIHVLDFDEWAATEFQRLRKEGVRIGTQDLRIAAIVLSQRATLLSRNLRDFGRVPGLTVADWTA